jgi:MATE family multidrug resistance protein
VRTLLLQLSERGSSERAELRALVELAAPLAVAQVGNHAMTLVDTAMVGRLGAEALGGVGIGSGILLTLSLLGLGCVLGMDAPVAQALGAGDERRARRVLWHGLRLALFTGVPLAILLALSPVLLQPCGVEPRTAVEVRLYLYGRTPNVVTFLLFNALRSYLQAKGATRPVIVAMLVANVANFVGNYLLIYGDRGLAWLHLRPIGLPALGVMGSGSSSSIASALSVVLLARAVQALPAPDDPARRAADPELLRRVLGLGVPVGLQLMAEVGVFAIAGVLAGRMSARAVAAHQVAMTLSSLTFTVTVGIGAAASVRVGRHIGAGDTPAAQRAGKLALLSAVAFMGCSATLFFALPGELARALTDDPSVVRAAVPLILIAAAFQISDGLQSVAAGALRGAGDARAPLWANVVGHYAVGLPIAVALAFPLHLGAPGLWWGLLGGLTAVAIGLTGRFLRLTARNVARI